MGDSLSYPSSQNSNTIKFAHLIIIAWNNSQVCSFSFVVSVSSKLQSKLSAKAKGYLGDRTSGEVGM